MGGGTARDAMVKQFPRIEPALTVRQAILRLIDAGWLCGLVVDAEGTPVGTFGRREVLRALSRRTGGFYTEQELAFALLRGNVFSSDALRRVWDESWDAPVESMMGQDVRKVTERTPLSAVAKRFARGDADVAAVVRNGRAVGAIRPRDVLAWIAKRPRRASGPTPRA